MQNLMLPTRILLYSICSSIEYDLKQHILYCNQNINFTQSMKDKINSRIGKSFNDNPQKQLDALDLSDYVEIISSNPYIYKFNNETIDEFNNCFNKVIPIRNRVMHTKPTEIGDRGTLEELFNTIEEKFKSINWIEVKNTKQILLKTPELLQDKWEPKHYSDNYYHNLPEPEFDDTGYIGRNSERNEITELLIEEKYPVISIIGNGGIGKTAITVKILYDLIDNPKNPYEAIIWISLKTRTLSNGEFKEINDSIKSTAEMINKTKDYTFCYDENNPKESIIDFMKNFKTLLVIDNLETINDEEINSFIKDIPKNSYVLITSRTGLGELEYRYNLRGMNKIDGMRYFRELSKYYGLDLHQKSDNEINDILTNVLYYNPLSIKWYMNSIKKGVTEREILQNKSKLIEFCMSNVYDKLSITAQNILMLFQIDAFEMSFGEIDYFLGEDELVLKKAINELLSTNMLQLKNSLYQIDIMAKDYLQLYKQVPDDFFQNIINEKKKLNDQLQSIKVVQQNSLLDPTSISYNYGNRDHKIAAIYLNEALDYGKNKNIDLALKYIDKAINIAPNYFECYKVKGFLNATFKNTSEAIKSYQIAIDKCTSDLEYAIAYYIFSFFYTVEIKDNEKAYNLICQAEKHGKDFPEIMLQKVRTLTRLGRFEEAEQTLNSIIYPEHITDKVCNIRASVSANLYKRWAEVTEVRDMNLKIGYLKKGIDAIEKLNKIDKKTYINLLGLLKELSTLYYDNEAIKLLYYTLKKHENNIRTINNNDINYIKNNIESNRHQIKSYYYYKIINYLTDFRKLSYKITSENMGVVCVIFDRFGFISNSTHRQIFFSKNILKTPLKVGDIVTFRTAENEKGISAYNIKKINKTIKDF